MCLLARQVWENGAPIGFWESKSVWGEEKPKKPEATK